MDVKDAIEKRRAYRSLEPVEITEGLIKELEHSISLAPSCFNNQSAKFVFVYEPQLLKQLFSALSKGNEWVQLSSLVAVVFSKKEYACLVKGREYFLFDSGLAAAFLVLRATELGLVAHPIAGYDEAKVKELLHIPSDMTAITLVVIGKHSESINEILTDKQKEIEKKRPERFPVEKIVYRNYYKEGEKNV